MYQSVFDAVVAGSPNVRLYPDVLPQNPLLPSSVYTAVAVLDEEDVGGADVGLEHWHVQIDTYALTRAQADDISKFIRTQMLSASDLQVISAGGFWAYENDTKLYRSMREYSVWRSS